MLLLHQMRNREKKIFSHGFGAMCNCVLLLVLLLLLPVVLLLRMNAIIIVRKQVKSCLNQIKHQTATGEFMCVRMCR